MEKTIEKECKYHGFTKYTWRKHGYRCNKCGSAAVQKRRDKIKIMAVAHLGGKCVNCGYNKHIGALEFHHKDPSQKDFGISTKGYTRSWEKVKEEIEKCLLLCANCHREIHGSLA